MFATFRERRWSTIPIGAATVLVFAASSLASQTVFGLLVDPSGTPVSGVVTVLLDSASTVVARSLSDESGKFRLKAPTPGDYRIRTLRIGYRPAVTASLNLRAGADVSQRIVMSALPVGLDTVRVADRGACRRVATDSSAVVFAAWEQVRAALTAAELTTNGRGITATTIGYNRTLEPTGSRIRAQTSNIRTEYVRQPWRALAPDSLQRVGYVVSGPGDFTTFYAPGLDMLLSPAFVEDHCFRLGRAPDSVRLVVEFEPTPDRRRVAEIAGIIVLDRGSSELRQIEFRYANVPREESEYAGGEMDFTRMRNGGWVISRWSIRMPVLERAAASRSFRGQRLEEPAISVAELQVTGGALTTVVGPGNDTIWSHPPVTLTGVVVDSISHAPLSKSRVTLRGTNLEAVSDELGRFAIAGVLPGAYTAEVRTPALDSLNAVHVVPILVDDSAPTTELRTPTARQVEATLCGTKSLEDPGILLGAVTTAVGDSIPSNARVVATWTVIHLKDGGAGQPFVMNERRTREGRVARDGSFRLCGVPVNTALSLMATADGAESPEAVAVRIPPYMRYARAEVGLVRLAAGSALFSGMVVIDSTSQPIPAAEVALPDLGRTTKTNENGSFRIGDIPAGEHRVVVRHLGFAPLETTLTFGSAQRIERRVSLARATTLDSVHVVANAIDRSMASFDEHRKVALGHFLTRADLAKIEELSMSAALQSLSGLRLARGRANQAWVVSSRGAQSIGGTSLRRGDSADQIAGAGPACYAAVYVDHALVYAGRRTEPLFNVNTLRPSDLEAIEFYAGPAQTPGEYAALDATCGVVVIWTRRKP